MQASHKVRSNSQPTNFVPSSRGSSRRSVGASLQYALRTGHRLHWYEIIRTLGRGGYGITYLARDKNLGCEVAIKEYFPVVLAVRAYDMKVCPIDQTSQRLFDWGLQRFVEEAKTLTNFDHPNIVRVLMEFECNNTAYMVMRYEKGRSLQEIVAQRGTLTDAELLDLLLPILEGLEQVHERGFIHRDIKPANIYLRENGGPVLLDFGSARHSLGAGTQTLTTLISPGYAAFEQYCSACNEQGPWTDIYGLAATAYRVITGRVPMYAIDRSQAILKTGQDTLVPVTQCAGDRFRANVLAAIDHALCFRKEDRPKSVAAWRKELLQRDENSALVSLPVVSQNGPGHRHSALKRFGLLLKPFFSRWTPLLFFVPLVSSGWFYSLPYIKVQPAPSPENKAPSTQPRPDRPMLGYPPVRVSFSDEWNDSFMSPETMVILAGGYRIESGKGVEKTGSKDLQRPFTGSGRINRIPVRIENESGEAGIKPGDLRAFTRKFVRKRNEPSSVFGGTNTTERKRPAAKLKSAKSKQMIPAMTNRKELRVSNRSMVPEQKSYKRISKSFQPPRPQRMSGTTSRSHARSDNLAMNNAQLRSIQLQSRRALSNSGKGTLKRTAPGRDLAHVVREPLESRPNRSRKQGNIEGPVPLKRPGGSTRPDRSERKDGTRRIEEPERIERSERPDQPERIERAERMERPERPERVERPERIERAERPERPDRSGRR